VSTGTSSFDEAIEYALERLASGHLTLKEEQLKAIRAVYDKECVCMAPKGFWQLEVMLIMPFLSLWITSLVSLVIRE